MYIVQVNIQNEAKTFPKESFPNRIIHENHTSIHDDDGFRV